MHQDLLLFKQVYIYMFHIVQYMPDMTTLFLSKVLNTKTCIQNNSAKKKYNMQ